MKIISLILIAIIVPLTSFPTLIKAPPGGSSGGGGGFVGGGGGGTNSGYRSGGPDGFRNGGNDGYMKGGDNGYKSGTKPGKAPGGGNPGVAIVVIPKPPAVELPKECTEAVKECVSTHIAGDGATVPKRGGSCCTKLQHAVPCVCKFLLSKNPKLKNAANGVFRGCGSTRPICIMMEMPKTCKPEVINCINHHMYGTSGKPRYHGACCMKFKYAKSCVTEFLSSPDPKLSDAAKGVIQGCRFKIKRRKRFI